MKHIRHIIVVCLVFFSCSAQEPTTFSKEALNDTFVTLQGENVTFKDILEAHKGSTLVIDIWASWCKDCIGGMPKVKALQKAHPEVTYIFLSLDKTRKHGKKELKSMM